MEPSLITLQQLAKHTKLPAAWLKREAEAGRLPCIIASRRLRFDLNITVKALLDRAKDEITKKQRQRQAQDIHLRLLIGEGALDRTDNAPELQAELSEFVQRQDRSETGGTNAN